MSSMVQLRKLKSRQSLTVTHQAGDIFPQKRNPLQLLKGAFNLYRHNWPDFVTSVGLILFAAGAIYLALVFGLTNYTRADIWRSMIPAGRFIILLLTLVYSSAALTLAIAAILLGQPPTISNIYGNLAARTLSLVSALVVALLLALVIVIVGFVLIPLIGWLLTPGLLIFLGCLIALTPAIVVVERQSGWWAVARAWGLARQHFWRVLTVMFIVGCFWLLCVELPIYLLKLLGPILGTADLTLAIVFSARLLFGLIYVPFYAACVALTYFDLRIRVEGFDNYVLQDNLLWGMDHSLNSLPSMNSKGLAAAYAPRGLKGGKLLTFGEMGKFAFITVGAFALVISLVVGLVFWSSIEHDVSESISTTLTVNTTASDFTLNNLYNQPVTLSKMRGKPTVINFWASWCPPCVVEMPALQAIYIRHRKEINFLAVNSREKKGTVQSFANEKGLTFPVLLDTDGKVNEMYQIRGIPATIIVDADGVIVNRHVGSLDEATLEAYLEPLLQNETPIETY